jgi:hypothetical protein
MADVSITAANVRADDTARTTTGVAGATITAGQVVYADPVTGRYKLADNNSGTAAARSPVGIALHASLDGQPLTIALTGLVTIGGGLTAGAAYYLSDTPGGICPAADLGTGEYSVILGLARSASVLSLRISPPTMLAVSRAVTGASRRAAA